MSGLYTGIGGGIRIPVDPGGAGAPTPSAVQQVAYGAGSSPGKGGVETWHFQVGVAAAGLLWLVFLRWSLPKGGR